MNERLINEILENVGLEKLSEDEMFPKKKKAFQEVTDYNLDEENPDK